jgi:hypothetical protein
MRNLMLIDSKVGFIRTGICLNNNRDSYKFLVIFITTDSIPFAARSLVRSISE